MKRTDEQLQELLLRKLSKAGRLRRKQLIEAGIAALGMERGGRGFKPRCAADDDEKQARHGADRAYPRGLYP